MLWHEQKIQEGKDLWGAIKGTSKSAVDHLLDRPKDPITVDPLQGFENSEEKRSSTLFNELSTDTEASKSPPPTHDMGQADEQSVAKAEYPSQAEHNKIEKAANQFIELCVLYESLSWDDPNDTKTLRKIEAVAGKYMDNEEFRNRIESCGNDIVIERLHTEMEEQKHLLIQENHDSGVIKETSLSPGEIGGGHKAVSSIEKAANEFIDLCVLYESLSWDDPDDSKTLRKIEAVASKYMDNEEFKQKIEASKNEVAINRLQIEIEEQKQSISRGLSV